MYTIFDIISSEQIILVFKHTFCTNMLPLPPSLSKEHMKGITYYIYIFTSIIPTINPSVFLLCKYLFKHSFHFFTKQLWISHWRSLPLWRIIFYHDKASFLHEYNRKIVTVAKSTHHYQKHYLLINTQSFF